MNNETICWSCAKAGKGRLSECPWARDFTPVDGWSATETVKNYRERRIYSFLVEKCPLYEKDPPKKSAFDRAFAIAKIAAEDEIKKREDAGEKNCRAAVYEKYRICLCGKAFRAANITRCRKCAVRRAAAEQRARDKKKEANT